MSRHDVTAVIGMCAPARAAYATRLATTLGATLLSERALSETLDPLDAALRLSYAAPQGTVVMEFPTEADVTAIIGALTEPGNDLRLVAVVCVADAADILDDLLSGDFLWIADEDSLSYTSRALIAARQLEYSSMILVTGGARRDTAELLKKMAILSHLNPAATVLLDDATTVAAPPTEHIRSEQDGAGWLRLINHEFHPRMTSPRISAFLWENERPLHPERLNALFLGPWAHGRFGTVIRSAGLCHFATRPGIVGAWEQAGQTISLDPLAYDLPNTGEELLNLGQSIGIIGLHLDQDALTTALDSCTLTANEMLAGPDYWHGLPDPFPAWEGEPQQRG